jgi:hypothetical protein
MPNRPLSISIIGWFLVVTGGSSLVMMPTTYGNPQVVEMIRRSGLPVWLHYTLMLLWIVVSIGCGVGMLKGKNWSRYVYVTWSTLGMIIGFVFTGIQMIALPGIIILVACAVLLFRQNANAFFTHQELIPDASLVTGSEAHTVPDSLTAVTTFRKPVARKQLSMFRRVSSVLLLIVSGFLFYMATLIAFIKPKDPATQIAPLATVCGIAFVLLLLGLAVCAFQRWRLKTGIVFLSGAGVTAFVAAMLFCIKHSPQLLRDLPPESSESLDGLSNYVPGCSLLLPLLTVGILLILTDKKHRTDIVHPTEPPNLP